MIFSENRGSLFRITLKGHDVESIDRAGAYRPGRLFGKIVLKQKA
jgi:hypothetical protein